MHAVRKRLRPAGLLFPFVAAFIIRVVGKQDLLTMTHVHTNFSELPHLLNRKNMERVQALQSLNMIYHGIRSAMTLLKVTFYAPVKLASTL